MEVETLIGAEIKTKETKAVKGMERLKCHVKALVTALAGVALLVATRWLLKTKFEVRSWSGHMPSLQGCHPCPGACMIPGLSALREASLSIRVSLSPFLSL